VINTLGNGVDRIADLAKELVLGGYAAGVLPSVVVVASNLLRSDMLGVAVQHLSGSVIRPNDSMRTAHF
jgi:hypothetical protein